MDMTESRSIGNKNIPTYAMKISRNLCVAAKWCKAIDIMAPRGSYADGTELDFCQLGDGWFPQLHQH